MKPKLCAAGMQLRDQVDTWFPDRSLKSEGWLGDSRHAARKSDHNPDQHGWVRAIDVDASLGTPDGIAAYLADQIRIAAKTDKRLSYVIFSHHIASKLLNYKWRRYKGVNSHVKHIHISFTKAGDTDGKPFDIPLIGGKIG